MTKREILEEIEKFEPNDKLYIKYGHLHKVMGEKSENAKARRKRFLENHPNYNTVQARLNRKKKKA